LKFILSALLPAHLFLITPLSLFMANADEMETDLLAVLKLALLPFLVCFMLLYLLFRVLPAGVNRVLQISVVALTALMWIQSNLIVWDYGVLDGQSIDWSSYPLRGWVDAAVWIAVGGIAVLLTRRGINHAVWFLALLVAIQAVTDSVQAMNRPGVFVADARFDSVEDLEAMSRFSTDTNVLHLVIDGFQSDVLDYLVNHDEIGEQYREALRGFTFYSETLGVFPFTRFSVPAFLGGNIYKNEIPKTQFIHGILGGANLLNQSREQGYDLDVASGGRYWVNSYAKANTTNVFGLDNLAASDPAQRQTALLADLAIFRSLPHFLKRFVYNDQEWLLSRVVRNPSSVRHWYFIHTLFLRRVADNMAVDRDRPVYKYFHVMNTHSPMVVDAQCRYAGGVVPVNRATLTYQTKCTMDTLASLFQSMREHGVYDNTLIVVHGDHGGWVPNLRQGPVPRFADGTPLNPHFVSLASPLLAIKPIAATGRFQESSKLVSLLQLPDTVRTGLEWPGDYGHMPIQAQWQQSTPTRTFRAYSWQRDAWETDFTGPIYEFDVTGSHYETVWRHVNTIRPPN